MLLLSFLLGISVTLGQAENISCPPSKESIEKMISDAKIPGMAIVVVNRTHTLYKQGIGYTTPEIISTEEPIDPDRSIFLLASISKTFIAVAAMQLVEAGRLDLDQNINKYLPKDLAISHPQYPEKSITMKHLLSHTSSIGPNFDKEMTHFVPGDGFTKTNIAQVVLDFVNNQSNWLSVPPGSNVSYSNIGSTLAALVIEKITHIRFEDYILHRIIRPLGLNHHQISYRLSHFRPNESSIVQHYIYNVSLLDESKRLVPQLRMEKAENDVDWFYVEPYGIKNYPAGLLRSSATALSIYLRSFLNNFPRILSKASSTKQMIEPIGEINESVHVGLVWFWEIINGRKIVGHRGSIPAVANIMAANEQRNIGIVILTNGEVNISPTMAAKVFEVISNLLSHLFNCYE